MDNRAYVQHERPEDPRGVPYSSNRQNHGAYGNPTYQNRNDRGPSRDVKPDIGQDYQPQAPTRTKRQAPGAPSANQAVHGSSRGQSNATYAQQARSSLQHQRQGQNNESVYQNGHQSRPSQQSRDESRHVQNTKGQPRPVQQIRDQPQPAQGSRNQQRPPQGSKDQYDQQHTRNSGNSPHAAHTINNQQTMQHANDQTKSNQYTANDMRDQHRTRNQEPPQTNYNQRTMHEDHQRNNRQNRQQETSQQNNNDYRQQQRTSQHNTYHNQQKQQPPQQQRTNHQNMQQDNLPRQQHTNNGTLLVAQGQSKQSRPDQSEMTKQNDRNEIRARTTKNGLEITNHQQQPRKDRPVNDKHETTTRGHFHDNLGLSMSSENLTRGRPLQPHLSSAKSMNDVSYGNQMKQPEMTHARSLQNLLPSPKFAVQDTNITGQGVNEEEGGENETSAPPGGKFRKKRANQNNQAPVNRVSRNLQHAQSLTSLHYGVSDDPQGGNLSRAPSTTSINMYPLHRSQSMTSLGAVSLSSIHSGALRRAYSRDSLAIIQEMIDGPSSYFAHAVLSTVFCFFPTGFVAIVTSLWTHEAIEGKNFDLAGRRSSMTRLLIILTVIIGVFIWFIGICLLVYMIIAVW